MTEILKKIITMKDSELQLVMQAISDRYAAAYPQWDVVYMAVHKDPALREQELKRIWLAMRQDLESAGQVQGGS